MAPSRIGDADWDLSFTAKGTYEAGKHGEAQVMLDAKGTFHVNDKYPYKLALVEVEGVKFDGNPVTKDNVKLEHMHAVMTVGFTPAAAGKKTLSGKFSFSVCTDDKCLMEKRDLAVEIEVK